MEMKQFNILRPLILISGNLFKHSTNSSLQIFINKCGVFKNSTLNWFSNIFGTEVKMPKGLNGLELLRWFRQPETAFGKSIQRDWQFWGFFLYNPFSDFKFEGVTQTLKYVNKDFPPIIQPFHILGVTIPTYSFEKKIMWYGTVPRTFPVFNFEGFDLAVQLEEDERGSVEYFINWNQRNMIDKDGYYTPPAQMKIKGFVLEVQDKSGLPVVYYIFHDMYFLGADDASYSYGSNDSIKRTVTFGVDRMSTIFTKQNAIATAGLAASSLIDNLTDRVSDRVSNRTSDIRSNISSNRVNNR